jgi:hypothetical protein
LDKCTAISVDRPRFPCDAERAGGLRDGQFSRLDVLLQHNGPGVRRVSHHHGRPPVLVLIDIINLLGVTVINADDGASLARTVTA